MKIWTKALAAAGVLTGAALAAPQAYADCGTPRAAMRPAIYRGDPGDGFLQTDFPERAAITGLWKFAFTSDGTGTSGGPPAGAPVDAGFVTWHDDGTEIMNSGRAPVSGSFCMGVWKQIGPRTYRLNHWALSWVPGYVPGVTQSWSEVGSDDSALLPAGPANIEETVTVSADGSRYTGSFKILNYAYDGKSITDAVGEPFVISGTVTATRITP